MKTDDEVLDSGKNGEDESLDFKFDALSDEKYDIEDDVIELTDIIIEEGKEQESDQAEDDIAVLLDDEMIEGSLDLDEKLDFEDVTNGGGPEVGQEDAADFDLADLESDLGSAFEDIDEFEAKEESEQDEISSPAPEIIESEEDDQVSQDIDLQEDKRPPEIPLEDFSETVDPLSEEIEKIERLDVPQEAGISAVIPQERLEEIITAAVERTVEKVVRKTVSDVAEKVIREAIDALKESIEAESE